MDSDEIYYYFKKYSRYVVFALLGIVVYSWAHSFTAWKYEIWRQRQHGLAELARAESNRKIKIWEADADLESAKRYAEAEIIRARGVAEANQIIGDSLKDNEAYLRYRWIEGLQTNQMSVIYVPTEGNLPILEASRLIEEGKRYGVLNEAITKN